jgi:integrase
MHPDRGTTSTNQWLKTLTTTGRTSHSFRHAVITRLTLAEVSQGVIDGIVGHASQMMSRVASGYFHGYPLATLRDALAQIALPAPPT